MLGGKGPSADLTGVHWTTSEGAPGLITRDTEGEGKLSPFRC